MAIERGETTSGNEAKGGKPHKFLGSLRDALMAAGRDDTSPGAAAPTPAKSAAPPPAPAAKSEEASSPNTEVLSAEEAARLARTGPEPKIPEHFGLPKEKETDAPPTTRVIRAEPPKPRKSEPEPDAEAVSRTVLVRGKQKIEHGAFERDPVVGFLIVVGGPGLGSFRPIFEGNNTVGRSPGNRIPLDFGDDAISNEAQAYLRYDSTDRSFLFVPNLAKTNVVSVNDKRPAGPVPLQPMDVITLGRTQVAFLPFCGGDFDWSEISEA
ncbi:MAG TPA: FHA domain-containing protein [Hyphomicrobium sp.]|nr:FHA domain-containing protein [Hyphomicrobium sp.]